MVDLRAKPYCLGEEEINWVKNTIEKMTDREKVGQLFWQLTAGTDREYLKDLMETYHLGGCRYNPMPGEQVLEQNRTLQKHAQIPVFIACNPEQGGNGVCLDGTFAAPAIKVGATQKPEYARDMGRVAGAQMAAAGCNMAFAPVVDILYNWECEEVLSRSFGNDPRLVAQMGRAYMEGLHETPGLAACAKHFPGNGQDYRDAHVSNNVNGFDEKEWMDSYGRVYKELFENGLEAVMGGHILMPEYMKTVRPGIAPEEILPATLCPEVMTGLLRDKLGFNGVVVTDASHMVGMTNRMKRREMLPRAVNAGCDMFLFFNDPEEDFSTMLEAYTTGTITKERMTEALTRILGLKAAMGLHKKTAEELCPAKEELAAALNCREFWEYGEKISKDALTLVKYKDKEVLPLSPEKTRRIMIVPVKGAPGPMDALMALAMGKKAGKKTPAEELRDRLAEKGFEVFIYQSPLEEIKKQLEAGEQPSLNLYFAGKHAVRDFVAGQDVVITLFDVAHGHPAFGIAKGGGEVPWYVHELPVIGVSVNKPTMLADVPMLRTYINTYDAQPQTLQALVDALVEGPGAFKGKDPIDSYCGMWDTRI